MNHLLPGRGFRSQSFAHPSLAGFRSTDGRPRERGPGFNSTFFAALWLLLWAAVGVLGEVPAQSAQQPFVFYSMAHTNWPPLPFPTYDDCVVYSLGTSAGGVAVYVYDDREQEEARAAERAAGGLNFASMEDAEEGDWDAGPPVYASGPGLALLPPIFLSSNSFSITLTNTEAEAAYDLFYAPAMPAATGDWYWIARGLPGQVTFVITNFGADSGFFIAGTMYGLDEAGLTEAFRGLVGTNHLSNDFDADGLPDVWEVLNFGGLAQTASGDFDGDGLSNGTEYGGESDPNSIAFRLSFPTFYSSSNSIAGSFQVTGGVPAQMAMLVNDTNMAGATWVAYNPNFIVNLGSQDGIKSVWLGLRGRLPTSQQTWRRQRIIRDGTPPALVITNPVASLVSRPMIQLQGYSPEPLVSLRYDLTNGLGRTLDRQGFVVHQFYNTNTHRFTTNYWQCFDLGLAPGTNIITLRAVDLAGNATVTNLTCIFSTNDDTTAPVISLVWPQNGMKLTGTNFTMRGLVDDPTAAVTAEIVSADDTTNVVGGLVERAGLFWVEGLPLSVGTNTLRLSATDAAGNMATTNVTLIESDLGLAIDTIAEEELHQLTVNVSGTVSDSGYAVWVNGIEATVGTGGNWTAQGVPVDEGGTASFSVSAYPSGQHPLAGSGGSGFNPPNTNASNLVLDENKPDRIYVERYCNDWTHQILTYVMPRDYPQTQDATMWWANNAGGEASLTETFDPIPEGPNQCTLTWQWPKESWPPGSNSFFESHCDDGEHSTQSNGPLPWIVWEHCEREVSEPFPGGVEEASRSADVTLKLFTGGKRFPGREALFEVTGTAQTYLNPLYNGVLLFPTVVGDPLTVDIPVTSIVVGGLGRLGADGRRWAGLPEGATVDVTPQIDGVDFFRSTVGEVKHKLRIRVNENPLADDRVVRGAGFCVGQDLQFVQYFVPAVVGIQNKASQWSLSGDYVNESWQLYTWTSDEPPQLSYYGSVNYSNNPSLLTNENTHAWWVTGGNPTPRTETANITLRLRFDNGQTAAVSRAGLFTMYEPSIDFTRSGTSDVYLGSLAGPVSVQVGMDDDSEAMFFWAVVTSTVKFLGEVIATQLIDGSWSRTIDGITFSGGTSGAWELDNVEVYTDSHDDVARTSSGDAAGTSRVFDQPALGILYTSSASITDEFKTYFRFRPSGAGSIWITLGRADWGWDANTEATGFYTWSITSSGVSGPSFARTHEFPRWAHITSNFP